MVEPAAPVALLPLSALSARSVAWVRLIDGAEAMMYPAGASVSPTAQLTAASMWDAVYAYAHTLTPTERIRSRAYLWLRDNPEPLPSREERAALGWGVCPCTRCAAARAMAPHHRRMADAAPEAQRQYARVAAAHLSRALRLLAHSPDHGFDSPPPIAS